MGAHTSHKVYQMLLLNQKFSSPRFSSVIIFIVRYANDKVLPEYNFVKSNFYQVLYAFDILNKFDLPM